MRRKNFKKLLTTGLAGMVVLTVMTTPKANAETTDGTPPSTKQTKLSITKELQLGKGITIPEAIFKFQFNPIATDSVSKEDYKDIKIDKVGKDNEVEIKFSETEDRGKVTDTGNNYVKVEKVTEDLLQGIKWPHAGQYKYEVTEALNTYNGQVGEVITYDDATYTVYINVKNSEDGPAIDDIFVTIPVAGGTNSKGEVEDEGVTTPDGKINLPFVNIYNKYTNGADDQGVNNSLEISKEVVSSSSENDLSDKEKQFKFEMTLTKVGTLEGQPKYTYVKFVNGQPQKKDGQVETITVTTGEQFTFTLAHNEKIVFQNLPGGTTYTVNEQGTSHYKPSYIVKEGGIEKQDADNNYGDSLPATNMLVVDTDEAGNNAAAYTNTFDNDSIFNPETGILTDNFPFILLILLGVAAFGVNVVVKRRHSVK